MNTATTQTTAPVTLSLVVDALRALPGVTVQPMRGAELTSIGIYVAGRFVAMAGMELAHGKLTGRISVSRDTGRKLGPAVYRALISLAPCHID